MPGNNCLGKGRSLTSPVALNGITIIMLAPQSKHLDVYTDQKLN